MMEPYDAEVEWALTHNIEPADHIAALTRNSGCVHPLEQLSWNAYHQVLECECGAWILIEDLPN